MNKFTVPLLVPLLLSLLHRFPNDTLEARLESVAVVSGIAKYSSGLADPLPVLLGFAVVRSESGVLNSSGLTIPLGGLLLRLVKLRW